MRPDLFEWAPHTGLLCITTFNTESQQGVVAFWAHTGEKKEKCAYGRECEASCISWHPHQTLVAAGWKDGGINLLTPQENEVTATSVQDPDLQSITNLVWSHDGKYLCALEESSTVTIFLLAMKKSMSKVFSTTLPSKTNAMCRRITYDKPSSYNDTEGLAREEEEEDMKEFNEALKERNRKMGVSLVRHATGTEFIFGLEDGQVFGIDNTGKERNLHKVESGILFIEFYEARSMIVLLTKDPLLYHLVLSSDGTCAQKLRVKLPGQSANYRLHINEFLLLICNCEKSQSAGKSAANVMMVGASNGKTEPKASAQVEKKGKDATGEIRIWDLDTDDNGTISLLTSRGFDSNDSIECVTASLKRGIISAGTANGKVANWKRKKGEKVVEAGWKLQAANKVGGDKVLGLSWCPLAPSLAVVTDSELVILEEDNIIVRMRNKISAVQMSATSFILLNVVSSVSQELKLPITPKGIHLGDKQLVVWSGEMITTYDVQSSLATFQSTSFACNASDVIIHQQTLYCIEGDKINSRTLQGTVRQILSLPEMEGNPTNMHLNRNFLVVATSTGFLRIYNLAAKDAHQEHHAKYAVENVGRFHSFIAVRINVAGNKVAFTFRETPVSVADKIMVWDAEGDSVAYFSFNNGMTDQQEYDAQAELAQTSTGRPVTAAARKMEKEQNRYRMMLHKPGELHWDDNDPRYLVAEAIHQQSDSGDNRIISMFVTTEHGILLQDIQPKSPHSGTLLSVCVPYLYFAKKSEWDDGDEWKGEKTVGRTVLARILKEFSGCEGCDDATRKAMMDFCFFLTLGKMDDAFKAIQFVKSESVWEEMSSMSVKTRRLDVAAVCLGHMRNVRGARALRKAQEAGESEAMQCAALALELGMLDEAENLYAMNGRFDMVNKINQAQNAWSQAFEIAERKDRIHLRNTYYNYGKYLEELGAVESAIDNYERAEVHQLEASRIYMDNPRALENYVRRKRDPELHRWWANYLESIGELDGAINFYLAAKDNLAVVRIKIIQGKHKEAAALAEETSDRAACYKMGRFYEAQEDFQKAVTFYSKAHAYSSAIRIAKEHDMKDRLANLCLMAGESEMVEAARYYEDMPGYAHKAVMLYHKAGMIGRALDLAFRTEQFSALDLITKDFDSTTNPSILKRAAEFFAGNQNYEKAVQLLSMAKQYRDAVNLCKQRNVRITDAFAELLTPTKESIPNDAERKDILVSIAELCLHQGAYATAAKKLTQAGDTLRAMRALIKSGDTEKIRFFANTARKKEIYILAANYLQTTNWQADPDIIRDIEAFYSKAQSFEHLANFYKSCAYMEAESWRAFDRAKQALEMAAMCVQRAREKEDRPSLQETEHGIKCDIVQLTKLDKASNALQSDHADGIRQLTSLAEEAKEVDIMVPQRIYAIVIEEHASRNNFSAAYRVVTQFQKKFPKFDLTTVVPISVLNQICDDMKVERIKGAGSVADTASDDENEVEFSHAMKRMQNKRDDS